MKKTHKSTIINQGYYTVKCFGKIGTFPEIRDNWDDVTCKRCLKKRPKLINN